MPQIGWLEILAIVIIAILVLGPKEFPIALKKIGSYFAKLKNTVSSFQREFTSVTKGIDIEKDLLDQSSSKKKIDKNNFIINNVVEKPSIKTSPSNNAVIGRYILPKTIFSKLKSLKPGKSGEFHITDAIQALIEDNHQFIGHNFSGKYLDCGTMKGYIKSTLEISKQ